MLLISLGINLLTHHYATTTFKGKKNNTYIRNYMCLHHNYFITRIIVAKDR